MSVPDDPIPTRLHAVLAPPLRVAFSWTLAGNVIYSGCTWAMVLVLAKLGSPKIVGQFALGMAIAAPIFMFTNLQLRAVQATDSSSEFEFADYFTLRCLATALGFATVVILVLASHFDRLTSIVVLLAAGTKVVESLSDVVAGLLQRIERLDQLSICLMVKGTISLLVFSGTFWKSGSLAAALLGMVLTWLLIFVTYELHLSRKGLPDDAPLFRFNAPVLRHLVTLSLPLGLVMALGSLSTNIPRYVLEHYMGAHELGIFASLAYLGTSATIVITALGQSASARLSRMFADRQFDAFVSLIRKFIIFGALLGIVGVPIGALVGRQLISVLYRPEYAHYLNVFVVMIATTSMIAIASFLGYAVTSARSFKTPVLAVGTSAGVTAILSLLLVPKFGIMGATLALLFASVAQALGLALILNSELHRARRLAESEIIKTSLPNLNQPFNILSKGAL